MPAEPLTLPNFLLIGAQRSGTTWLYQVLRRHPQIYMPETKEVEYFSRLRVRERLGLAGYARTHFSGVRRQRAIGEASPSYLWTSRAHAEWLRKPPDLADDIPDKVREELGPATKLVVILRDPARRAISAFLHHVARGRLDKSKGLLAQGHAGGIIHMGFYFAHLEEWLRRFPRENFHVLIFEEAMREPPAHLPGLFRFLGVDSVESPAAHRRFNRGPTAVEVAGEVYLEPGGSGEGQARPSEGAGRELLVSRDEMDRLREIYRSDVQDLSARLGLKLDAWLG